LLPEITAANKERKEGAEITARKKEKERNGTKKEESKVT
jgi:hypothetical protein